MALLGAWHKPTPGGGQPTVRPDIDQSLLGCQIAARSGGQKPHCPTGRWLLPDQTGARFGPAATAPGCRPKRAPTRWGLGMHHGPWGPGLLHVARQAPTASQRSAPPRAGQQHSTGGAPTQGGPSATGGQAQGCMGRRRAVLPHVQLERPHLGAVGHTNRTKFVSGFVRVRVRVRVR